MRKGLLKNHALEQLSYHLRSCNGVFSRAVVSLYCQISPVKSSGVWATQNKHNKSRSDGPLEGDPPSQPPPQKLEPQVCGPDRRGCVGFLSL